MFPRKLKNISLNIENKKKNIKMNKIEKTYLCKTCGKNNSEVKFYEYINTKCIDCKIKSVKENRKKVAKEGKSDLEEKINNKIDEIKRELIDEIKRELIDEIKRELIDEIKRELSPLKNDF